MDAAELVVRITGDIDHVSRSVERISRDTSTMANRIERAASRGFGALERWAKRGALAASVAIAGIAAGVLQVGTAYEDALNTFEVVSSATAAQMDQVAAKAKELGNDLTLPATSAADAADAMTELAKAGLSVEESMDAAKGVLQLAAAAQVEEAQAAEYAASALNAFEMEGKDAIRVADLLAGASVAAMGEIADMADAMKMSAAVFNMAGFTVEDLTTAIAMMAQAGIKGSDAGTSLKQAILQLTAPTEKAAGLIKDLGIEIYDSRGQMKPFRDVINEVTEATAGLSEEQRNAALKTIFGADAVRAAAVVFSKGTEEFDKMAEAVTRQGVAAEVAAARTEGLKGAWDGIRSTLETAALTLYNLIAPPVTEFLRGIGKGLNELKDDPAWQRISRVAKETFGPFLDLIDRIGRAMQEGGFRAGFEELRRSIEDGIGGLDWNVIIDRLLAGLAAARPRIMAVGTFLLDAFIEFLQVVDWARMSEEFTNAMVGVITAVNWSKLAETATFLLIEVLPQIIDGFTRGIIKAAAENPVDFVLLLVTLGFTPVKVLGALTSVLAKIPIFGPVLAWLLKGFGMVGRAVMAPIREILKRAGRAGMGGMRDGLKEVWDDIARWFGGIGGRVKGFFAGADTWLYNAGRAIIRGLWNGARSLAGGLLDWLGGLGSRIIGAIGRVIRWGSPAKEFVDMGEDSMRGLMLGFQAHERALLATLAKLGAATLEVGRIAFAPPPAPAPMVAAPGPGCAGLNRPVQVVLVLNEKEMAEALLPSLSDGMHRVDIVNARA